MNGEVKLVLERVGEAVGKQGSFDLWLALGDPMTPTMSLEDRACLADLITAGGVSGIKTSVLGLGATLHLGSDALAERLKAQRGEGLWMAQPLERLELQGLSILNVAGQERTHTLHTNRLLFSATELTNLDLTGGVHLVCSSEWPARICDLSATAPPQPPSANALLTELQVAPRYWFSHGLAWEREPFTIDNTVCRFVSLAMAGSVGHKWAMALNLDLQAMPRASTGAATPNPLRGGEQRQSSEPAPINYRFAVDPTLLRKRPSAQGPDDEETRRKRLPPKGYACRRCQSTEHYYQDCPHTGLICHGCRQPGHKITECPERLLSSDAQPAREGKKKQSLLSKECWFCLNTTACQKHLIVSVGDALYLSLAKGPLSPTHLLLIPIEHRIEDEEALRDELALWRNRLVKQTGKQAIWWDTRHASHHHWHQQLLLVDQLPANLSKRISEYAERVGFPLKRDEEVSPALRFEIATADWRLQHEIIDERAYFPANFGRQALLECLDLECAASDWRRAGLTEAQETAMVDELKGLLLP